MASSSLVISIGLRRNNLRLTTQVACRKSINLQAVSCASSIATCLRRFRGTGVYSSFPLERLLIGGKMLNTAVCANGLHAAAGVKDDYKATAASRTLTMRTINPNIPKVEYAVRGPLVIRATEIEKELLQGVKKPFKNVIKANIGDAHAMGQMPITFIRQVLSLCSCPSLLDHSQFPIDVKERARKLLECCSGGSIGSYSASVGLEIVRKDVAEYISRRDGGIPSDAENIVLANGASTAIRDFLAMFNTASEDEYAGNRLPAGVMVPIPQYPLYSATLSEYGMYQIGYYLDEKHNWALDVNELQRALHESRKKCNPRVIVVINPGNPTGQVLTRQNIEGIIKFAYKEKLFLFADEVYQDNIYDPNSKFYSFKKVMHEMGEPYKHMELASFHSVSKGYMGECGLRGGYSEVVNCDPDVMAQYKKAISARLCSTVVGQIVMDCIVNPPKAGEASYDLFQKEKQETLQVLGQKAKMVSEAFNSIEGITCNPVQGAMYAFPRLHLPQKAIDKAKALSQAPDFYYAMQLLESSGICIVPGSGFCQQENTWHFRTTILPSAELFQDMLQRFKAFHVQFLAAHK